MEHVYQFMEKAPDWLLLPGIALLCLVFASAVRFLCLKTLNRMVSAMPLTLGKHFLQSLKSSTNVIAVVLAIQLTWRTYDLIGFDLENTKELINDLCRILTIVAVIVFIDSFSNRTIKEYAHSPLLQNSHGLLRGACRLVIIMLGGLIILSTLGISITPIVASLGITSLAVALALQPTLENFFSGLQLIADRPIRVGDYIELESGEQGFVDKIGWRSTWIRMLPNNIVIMPNSALSESKIINYYYPSKELSVPVEVGVHYDSDLQHVENVTLDVAKEILQSHKWGVSDYDTFVVFHTFDSSSINFTVMLRAKEYFNRFFIKSEFIKALHKRYREEGIVIPYPIRAINTSQEKVTHSDIEDFSTNK